jgi:broad specificity phosphatase PhoE
MPSFVVDDRLSECLSRRVCPEEPIRVFDDLFKARFPKADTSAFKIVATYPEKLMQTITRFESAGKEIAKAHPGQTVVLVTHSHGMRIGVSLFCRVRPLSRVPW